MRTRTLSRARVAWSAVSVNLKLTRPILGFREARPNPKLGPRMSLTAAGAEGCTLSFPQPQVELGTLPVQLSARALDCRLERAPEGVSAGLICSSSATAPATWAA